MNSNLSRRLALIAAGVVALGVTTGGMAQTRPAEVKLGIALSLTGNNAESGRDSKRGIELALEEMNRAGRFKNTKVTLVEADDASDSNRAVTAVQRLASSCWLFWWSHRWNCFGWCCEWSRFNRSPCI